jgi:hypothetical protein
MKNLKNIKRIIPIFRCLEVIKGYLQPLKDSHEYLEGKINFKI